MKNTRSVLMLNKPLEGNTMHELVGTGVSGLLILHNIYNRHWYLDLLRKGRQYARRKLTRFIDLSLVLVALGLLASSILVSRLVFVCLGLDGGFLARQIHTLSAHWVLVLTGLHLGMHWHLVMNTAKDLFGIGAANALRTVVLRLLMFLVAIYGVQSSFKMNLGSKLVLYFTFDYWDFENAALQFLLRYMSIIGLYAAIGHYVARWGQEKTGNGAGRGLRT